ncbi:DNA primase [Patescibacteria group bacterium]|nr:DNA primase [Patescibacteria group bacterium]
MADHVEEIKSKLDILDVVSEYVQLKQSGSNFRGLCPFHQEKTPSFFVSPDRQIYHCFGCGEGGDMFSFIQKIEGVDFPEALRILAEKAGVEIKQYDSHNTSQRTKLLDICELSAKFYHKILLESSSAEEARKYLEKRGVSSQTIAAFQLGFVPDQWDTLFKFLSKRKYQGSEIEAAGLVVSKQKGSGYYDRFRCRLMFPINDAHGQVVGFTGRVLPSKKKKEEREIAKYINTPETEIYNKSRVLYGLDKAKLEAKKKKYFILVEGNMDVLACHQAGYKNTICSSGTALTTEQAQLLKRYAPNILLAFDMDMAGQNATKRGIDVLLGQGLNVKIVNLGKHKDPDEFIQKDGKGWKKALIESLPIMEYYFSSAFQPYQSKGKQLLKIEDKKEITKKLLPVIAKLGDSVEQGLWLRKLAEELSVSEVFLRDALQKMKTPYSYSNSREVKKPTKEKESMEEQSAKGFLGLVLKNPKLGAEFFKKQNLLLDIFPSLESQKIAGLIRDYYQKYKKIDQLKIKNKIKDRKLENYYDFLLFLAEKNFTESNDIEISQAISSFFLALKKKYLRARMDEAMNELREAEKAGQKKLIEKASKRITKISQDLAD